MACFSISTWSLHRQLGRAWYEATPGGFVNRSREEAQLRLLDVPSQIAKRGIGLLEICHFHFPSTDEGYLNELKGELKRSDVRLFNVLIDAGDITHFDPVRRKADLNFIRGWIDVAAHCGAEHVRVIAGDAEDSDEAIGLSAEGLTAMAAYGRAQDVAVMTENFKRLTSRAAPLLEILNRCDGQVGLCTDFGNFKGETKYDDLAAVLPRADSIHAKADYEDGKMIQDAFTRCLDLAKDVMFNGPYTLIFQDPGDEWVYLDRLKKEIAPYLTRQ